MSNRPQHYPCGTLGHYEGDFVVVTAAPNARRRIKSYIIALMIDGKPSVTEEVPIDDFERRFKRDEE